MRRQLKRGGGRARYRLRGQVVEPAFGRIKEARGFRRFLPRGLGNVAHEWAMIRTAHNSRSWGWRQNRRFEGEIEATDESRRGSGRPGAQPISQRAVAVRRHGLIRSADDPRRRYSEMRPRELGRALFSRSGCSTCDRNRIFREGAISAPLPRLKIDPMACGIAGVCLNCAHDPTVEG